MGENSKIEWTTHTFNPWVGCTKLSSACDFCYAEAWSKRAGRPELWNGARSRTSEANWRKPIKWNAAAEASGQRARVFCCSLADVFDNQADPKWRFDLFALIRATPWLEWQLLTKRPQNIVKMVEAAAGLPWNVALGTTIEDQHQAGIRAPALLSAASKLNPLYTFFSCEPLLGPLDLWLWLDPQRQFNRHVDWVICGGESGHGARPMHPDWARSIRDQCATAGVPFLFKQWGEWADCEDWPSEMQEHLELVGKADGNNVRVGKAKAGRLLDGVEHNGFPKEPIYHPNGRVPHREHAE